MWVDLKTIRKEFVWDNKESWTKKRKSRFEVSNRLEVEVFEEELLIEFWDNHVDSWNVGVFDKE